MDKIKFSNELRLAALREVRALHEKRNELEELQDAKEKELTDIRREISEISEMIKASCTAFHFEYRGVRDENGKLISNGKGGYKRKYDFEEEDAPE